MLFLLGNVVFADEQSEALKFFNSYVFAANNYKADLFSKYYDTNPAIYRVVEKKDGSRSVVRVPFNIYIKESKKGQGLARIVRYKNNYANIKITPTGKGKDYKISAIRKPTPGGSYPAYFVVGKDANGEWKIKVESMNTPRQEFLQ